MKNHMMKVNESSYMKRVMAVKATAPTEQEEESTKAQHTRKRRRTPKKECKERFNAGKYEDDATRAHA